MTAEFERIFLPFLDDAYALTRHLTRNGDDAQDVVHEAYLRGLRYWGRHPVDHPRAWFLTIVRRTVFDWRRESRAEEPFDESLSNAPHSGDTADGATIASSTRQELMAALDALPAEFREVIVLRELRELSYREIGLVIGIPMGTVMSRLSRGRERLRQLLAGAERG